MSTGQRRPRRQRARADGDTTQTVYSAGVGLEICRRLAEGERWTFICNTGRLPACSTLYNWRRKHPAFAEALVQARELAAEGGGRLTGADLQHLKGLLMTNMPAPRSGGGTGELRPISKGKKVLARYSAERAAAICELLANGEPWCRHAGRDGMPSYGMLRHWRKVHPEFDAAVIEAKQIGAEARFDRALAVAEASTHKTVNSDKVAVATLMAQAAMMDPENYGKAAAERGVGGGAEGPVRLITIRRFERAWREDGSEYVRVIDSVQQVEDGR